MVGCRLFQEVGCAAHKITFWECPGHKRPNKKLGNCLTKSGWWMGRSQRKESRTVPTVFHNFKRTFRCRYAPHCFSRMRPLFKNNLAPVSAMRADTVPWWSEQHRVPATVWLATMVVSWYTNQVPWISLGLIWAAFSSPVQVPHHGTIRLVWRPLLLLYNSVLPRQHPQKVTATCRTTVERRDKCVQRWSI